MECLNPRLTVLAQNEKQEENPWFQNLPVRILWHIVQNAGSRKAADFIGSKSAGNAIGELNR